jgi:hypothetical protein
MNSSRLRGAVSLALGLSMAATGVSCSTSPYERCLGIPAGTAVASLPLDGHGFVEGSPLTPPEMRALRCCYPSFRDAGICPG